MVSKIETFEEVAPGIVVRHAENTGAYRSGKVWKSGGPLGEATRDGAALLAGIAFRTPESAERFLLELVKRTGLTEEATGIPLDLLCSGRQTSWTWGHYNPWKILAGRRVARLVLYRWSAGTLVHEFAHHVDYIFQEGEGLRGNATWHSPRFYEILRELHGIAFEILGTTEEAEYARWQERVNLEEREKREAEQRRQEALARLKRSEAALEEYRAAA
jgi:hypothetical protein